MPDLQELSPEANLALKTAARNIRHEFDGTFSVETIEQFLATSHDQFADRATITNFLPLIAERFARQRLHALARVEGRHDDGVPCPIFPGKRYEDWVLDDPAGLGLDAVRPIREEVGRHASRSYSTNSPALGNRSARPPVIGRLLQNRIDARRISSRLAGGWLKNGMSGRAVVSTADP